MKLLRERVARPAARKLGRGDHWWQSLRKLSPGKLGFAQTQGRSACCRCRSWMSPRGLGGPWISPSHRTPSRRPGPLEISFPSHSSPPHPARSPGSQPSRLRSLKPSLGSGPGRPRPPPSLPPERGGGSLPWKNVLVCPPVWLRDQSRVSATKKGFRKERAARSWPGSCRHCCAPKTRVS